MKPETEIAREILTFTALVISWCGLMLFVILLGGCTVPTEQHIAFVCARGSKATDLFSECPRDYKDPYAELRECH